MQILDWTIVAALVAVVIGAVFYTKKSTQSVADFLAANRCARRYLLSVSSLVAGFGALAYIGFFEAFYQAGFPPIWWQLMSIVQGAVIAVSGWVGYRYRQTRVLTLGQFFEMRYSKKFRIFAGMLAWVSGVINFGIFPAVGARFFIYFCGLPDNDFIFAGLMFLLLLIAIFSTLSGGHITVMVTDFIQGTFCNIVLIFIMVFLLLHFSWDQIIGSLSSHATTDSMVNPFSFTQVKDFNVWFYVIVAFLNFYGAGVWQSHQAYGVCAINAHESRMGGIVSTWRVMPMFLAIFLMAVCAYTFMHHPDFASGAAKAKNVIAAIENPTIQKQVTTPIAISFFIPIGLKGALVALMFAGFITSHNTMLHSWGTMFIQDVVLPFKKHPFTPTLHIRLLRLSIIFVAIVIFLFSFFFRQTEYVHMYFMISASVFVGGAGSVLLGGLYWKRGTTTAAWCALTSGAVGAIAGIAIRQINSISPFKNSVLGFIASQNASIISCSNAVLAIILYVVVSLCWKRSVFNMDKLLHRGEYTIMEVEGESASKKERGWQKWLGMGSEFNLKDKIIYLATSAFTFLLGAIFVAGTIYNLCVKSKMDGWVTFWRYYVLIIFSISLVTTIWFIIGGFQDLSHMFKLLAGIKQNDSDDGMVTRSQEGEKHELEPAKSS